MKIGFRIAIVTVALGISQPLIAASDSVWRNPRDSAHVRAHPRGGGMCGTVVGANEKAKADLARGGTADLIGTELFRDFHETRPNLWTGKVFVPDLNRVFSGTGSLVDANTIIARGCLTGSFGCKSQRWTRAGGAL